MADWDPTTLVSREEYVALAREQFELREGPLWWINREIRVYWEPGIFRTIARMVQREIYSFVRAIPVIPAFHVELIGPHLSALEQIEDALTDTGVLDADKLLALARHERYRDECAGGSQHADVYIVRRDFSAGSAFLGSAEFRSGACVFRSPGNWFFSSSFFRRIVWHEMAHLFGFQYHCNTFQNVEGYAYTPTCVMHSDGGSGDLCPKCLFFLQTHWEFLRSRTGLIPDSV